MYKTATLVRSLQFIYIYICFMQSQILRPIKWLQDTTPTSPCSYIHNSVNVHVYQFHSLGGATGSIFVVAKRGDDQTTTDYYVRLHVFWTTNIRDHHKE